jgi:hypothetical protein
VTTIERSPQQGRGGEWTIYPSCVPVVGDLREPLSLPVACRLHVAGSEGLIGGDAVLTGGQWSFSSPQKAGMQCPDGSWAPTTETYEFDDVTMTGNRTVFHADVCGLALPIPVEQYPLYCEPGGLKRCF